MNKVEDRLLTEENVADTNCCPGGLEVQGKMLTGDITRTLMWRQEMLKQGMKGVVSYHNGVARGFAEYMPAERAPFPIEAPGGGVLMCYHWEPLGKGDQKEHLDQEKRLINLVVAEVRESFTGLATLGWDNAVHFPVVLLEELGFQQLERCGDIALMWLQLKEGAPQPQLAPTTLVPQDLSSQGLLAIESAWSSRCPYSIHNAAKLEQVIARLSEDNRTRIRHFSRSIDTHEDAVRWTIVPWNWEWAFVNGEEVLISHLGSDELERLITDAVATLRIM
jgi:hypothetical protein